MTSLNIAARVSCGVPAGAAPTAGRQANHDSIPTGGGAR